MKRGGPDHPKVHALAACLGIERWGAVGILESLFHWAAAYTPEGDVGRWGPQKLAIGIHWEGKPEELQAALIESGWLEVGPSGAVIIHGWSEHSDDAVNMKLARARSWFADGQPPKVNRLSGKERADAEAFYRAHEPVHTEPDARKRAHDGARTALPSPSPPMPSHSSPSQAKPCEHAEGSEFSHIKNEDDARAHLEAVGINGVALAKLSPLVTAKRVREIWIGLNGSVRNKPSVLIAALASEFGVDISKRTLSAETRAAVASIENRRRQLGVKR